MFLHGARLAALAVAVVAVPVAGFAVEPIPPTAAVPGDTEPAVPPSDPESDGPLMGPRYGYAAMNVIPRSLVDVVAIPANVPSWDAQDWAQFAVIGGTVAGLWFWDANPSPDVKFDRWTTEHVSPHVPTIWNNVMQPALWVGIAGTAFGTWWWSATHDRPDIAQGCSLMGEALAVSQAYHITLKVLIGREGPGDGSELGRVLGPFQAIKYYPGGTPSGHAATLYSLLSSGLAYYQPPLWVHVLGHSVVGGLVVAHIIDHRHYVSESLWGSAMGWYVGQWVVRHRMSREIRDRRPDAVTADLVPLQVGRGLGLGLVGRF